MKQTFKKVALWCNHGMLVFLLFVLPSTFLLSFIFTQPNTVKTILGQSGVYEVMSVMISDASANSLETSVANYGISGGIVRGVSKSVFSADTVQKLSEKFINSAFRWLDGDVPTLVIGLDMQENQKEFVSSLSRKFVEIMERKPVCSDQELQQIASGQTSVLQASCRPATLDISSLQNVFTQDGVDVQAAAVTGMEIAAATNNNETQQLRVAQSPVLTNEVYGVSVPVVFDVAKNSFYLVVGLLIVTLVFLYILLKDWRKYISNIAKPLLTTGILLGVYGLLSAWVISQKLLSKVIPGEQGVLTDQILHTFTRTSVEIVLIFAGLYVVCGAILLIILHRTKKPPSVTTAESETPPNGPSV